MVWKNPGPTVIFPRDINLCREKFHNLFHTCTITV